MGAAVPAQTTARGSRQQLHIGARPGERAGSSQRQTGKERQGTRQADRQTDNSEGEQATALQRSKARGESRQLSETDR